MKKLAIAGLGLALAACATASASDEASDEATYFVREGMVTGINPPILAIWDLQVEVMDDFGSFDPALMDDAKWAALVDAARQLNAESQLMATAEHYSVVNPASTLPSPAEGIDLAAIETRIQANPEVYRAMAQDSAEHARQILAAAEARDAATLSQLVNDAQPACQACHEVYWYPEE